MNFCRNQHQQRVRGVAENEVSENWLCDFSFFPLVSSLREKFEASGIETPYLQVINVNKDKDNNEVRYMFGTDEVLDVTLSAGDRVIISATSNTPTLFERITSTDSRISSVKIAVIG